MRRLCACCWSQRLTRTQQRKATDRPHEVWTGNTQIFQVLVNATSEGLQHSHLHLSVAVFWLWTAWSSLRASTKARPLHWILVVFWFLNIRILPRTRLKVHGDCTASVSDKQPFSPYTCERHHSQATK